MERVGGTIRCEGRHGKGGFGFEERVVDALGLKHLVDGVSCRCERRVGIAPGVGGGGEDVAVELPYRVLDVAGIGARSSSSQNIGDRFENPILNVYQRHGGPRLDAGLCNYQGEYIAEEAGATALGDEDRPVLVDDSAPQRAGHVGSGDHRHHALCFQRCGGVDLEHVGPGVCREHHRAVEAPFGGHVIDEAAIAERKFLGLVFDATSANAP